MLEEPNHSLPVIGSGMQAVGGESQESATLLRDLDQLLVRRATAIEAELREISLVRKRIETHLSLAANNAVGAPSSLGAAGARLGQMI